MPAEASSRRASSARRRSAFSDSSSRFARASCRDCSLTLAWALLQLLEALLECSRHAQEVAAEGVDLADAAARPGNARRRFEPFGEVGGLLGEGRQRCRQPHRHRAGGEQGEQRHRQHHCEAPDVALLEVALQRRQRRLDRQLPRWRTDGRAIGEDRIAPAARWEFAPDSSGKRWNVLGPRGHHVAGLRRADVERAQVGSGGRDHAAGVAEGRRLQLRRNRPAQQGRQLVEIERADGVSRGCRRRRPPAPPSRPSVRRCRPAP